MTMHIHSKDATVRETPYSVIMSHTRDRPQIMQITTGGGVIFVRCGCRFRYINCIDGISIWERQTNHQSTTTSCKGSFLVHQICLYIVLKNTNSRLSSVQFCTGGRLPSAEGASTGGRTARADAAKLLVENKDGKIPKRDKNSHKQVKYLKF